VAIVPPRGPLVPTVDGWNDIPTNRFLRQADWQCSVLANDTLARRKDTFNVNVEQGLEHDCRPFSQAGTVCTFKCRQEKPLGTQTLSLPICDEDPDGQLRSGHVIRDPVRALRSEGGRGRFGTSTGGRIADPERVEQTTLERCVRLRRATVTRSEISSSMTGIVLSP